jgi:serine/threonine-protein kinase
LFDHLHPFPRPDADDAPGETERRHPISSLGDTLVTSNPDLESLEMRLRSAQAELERRIHAGEECSAKQFFDADAELKANKDAAIELIYTEYRARKDVRRPQPQEDIYRTFPQWRKDLERLFAIDEEIADDPSERVLRIRGPDGAVEQYSLLKEIAHSPNSEVCKARAHNGNDIVAIKTFTGSDLADAERFRTGAIEQKRLRHANILPVYAVGESEDGQPRFAMEFADGGSLDQRIAGQPQVPAYTARLVRTLAVAMDYAHGEGIVHRDLKPANVVLTVDGATPKITDFGLARRPDGGAGVSIPGQILGTPPYMAPEQAAGRSRDVGPLSDVYALGAILYELLTGKPPFQGETVVDTLQQVLHRLPPRPRRLQRDVPRELQSICLKCLEKNPRRRYPSAQALADDLGRWIKGAGPNAHRPAARTGRLVRRHPALSIALGLALIAALLVPAASYLMDPERERERIEKELAQGKEVTLIGEQGWPRWHDWASRDKTQKVFLRDGVFCVDSWGVALLELVRDPQVPAYSFSTWVRHESSDSLDGTVGIYFARTQDESEPPIGHMLCSVRLNCRADERNMKPKWKGNCTFLRVERLLEPSNTHRRTSASPPLFIPISTAESGIWRKISVEVSAARVKFTVWRDAELWNDGQSTEAAIQLVEECANGVLHALDPLNPVNMGVNPRLALRGSLGLYVQQGSASFRNTVVKPLPN